MLPEGSELKEQRLDETEVGEGTMVVLIDAKRPTEWKETTRPADCAAWLRLQSVHDLVSWDVFDAVLTPADIILMITFKDKASQMCPWVPWCIRPERGCVPSESSATTACLIAERSRNTTLRSNDVALGPKITDRPGRQSISGDPDSRVTGFVAHGNSADF